MQVGTYTAFHFASPVHKCISALKIRVLPEQRDEIQAHAKTMGESTTAFMKRAIVETMERDKNKPH